MEQITSWKEYKEVKSSKKAVRLHHGYERVNLKLNLISDDMNTAALFRGGQCLSQSMEEGDLRTKLK